MSAVAATSLTQRFGSELALDMVDLTVDTGEHLAVLGENGAGKTTLLRIIATAARPTSGSLAIFGLDAFGERRRLRASIGYVAHASGLYPALSAAENLEFFCTLQGVDRGRVGRVEPLQEPKRLGRVLDPIGMHAAHEVLDSRQDQPEQTALLLFGLSDHRSVGGSSGSLDQLSRGTSVMPNRSAASRARTSASVSTRSAAACARSLDSVEVAV